jgi:hypothetical protein
MIFATIDWARLSQQLFQARKQSEQIATNWTKIRYLDEHILRDGVYAQ